MNSKKIAAAVLAMTMAVGTVASFTGCSKSSDDKNVSSAQDAANNDKKKAEEEAKDKGVELYKVPEVDGKGATLTVYTNRTDRDEDGTFAKLNKAFEEKYNCKVEVKSSKDYEGDMKNFLSSGNYGDVLAIPDMKKSEFKNYLEPLGTYDEFKDTYRWVNEKMDSDKTVYGIPTGGTTVGVLYNKKVWSDAGITELPTTPKDFIADLKKIKESNKDVVPYYTNFKDGWCTKEWSNAILSSMGSKGATYKTDLLQNKGDLFAEDGGFYKVFKFMTDLYSDADLLENGHNNTDWEKSKVRLPQGKIGAMVLGHWAISQFVEKANENKLDAANVGYMPFPFTAEDGKQYAQISPDYSLGVSKNSKNKELAKAYVHWFVQDSGYAQNEYFIPTLQGAEFPEALSEFSKLESEGKLVWFTEEPSPDNLIGKWDDIETKANVKMFGEDSGNFNLQIAKSALEGGGEEGFKKIAEDTNKKWAAARDEILK